MAEQKFTSGPWSSRFSAAIGSGRHVVESGDGLSIAVIESTFPRTDRVQRQNEADARLIAMCPTMIEYIITHAALGESGAILIVREALGDAASKAIQEGTSS